MHQQLEAIVEELESALQRVRQLASTYPEEAWALRPAEGSWSASECIAHLNLTSLAYDTSIPMALAQARDLGGGAPRRFRRNFWGWLIWRVSGPRKVVAVKTKPRFVATDPGPRARLLAEFERLQDQLISWVQEADGLPIHRVQVASPFDARMRYSLYAAFTILAAHQHRHLGQAERALAAVSGGALHGAPPAAT